MRSLLSCHSCLWHCLRAVAHRPLVQPTALARNRHRLPRLALSSPGRRGYAAAGETSSYSLKKKIYEENWHAYAQYDVAKNADEDVLGDEEDKPERKPMRIRLQGAEKEFNYSGTVDETMRKHVRTELHWLGADPKNVADHTLKLLKKSEEEKALALAREASPKMQCTVAWNHIINHFMRKGFDNLALKAFNEMKKRGQKPDSYTYSLVLIGIQNNMDNSQALANAMAVYYSMSAPNSAKQPTILHTNIFLKICAKAQAFDQLWAVAGRIPDVGFGSADCATYTIILNALKAESERKLPDTTSEELSRKMDKAAVDARRIWADIVSKWRAHTITMDEQLVLAMGQILLSSSRPREHDEVFSLVEQTTGIPRMSPRISAQPDPAQQPQVAGFNVPMDGNGPKHNIAPGHEFDSVKPPRAVGGMHSQADLVKPSNVTLSLLMTACMKAMTKQAADKYWEILTGRDSYSIKPDEPSIKAYLRVLRVFRSSADAVQIVQTYVVGKNMRVSPAVFRIAMSACARDSKNKNSLDHATELLKIMEQKLPGADARTVESYLSRLLDAPAAADLLKGVQQVPIYRNLRSMLTYGKYQGSMQDEEQRQAIFDMMKRMQSCYDRLINDPEVPKEMRSELGQKKSEITAFLTRAFDEDMVKRGYDRDMVKQRRHEKETERKGKQRLKQGVSSSRGSQRSRGTPPWAKRKLGGRSKANGEPKTGHH
ncbi:hypothetical protein HDK90DRAFT_451207 [Phyllosticta capitalensis]|uniref:Pentatricopeptide repeat protein n=1 Tax=Phyllosticta capitalensis TaxID=121624 RepID=A0ABR1YTE2_9PEZI